MSVLEGTRSHSIRAHQYDAGQIWSGESFGGWAFRSFAHSLVPDEEECEKNEFRVVGHFLRNIEVHASRSFGSGEPSVPTHSPMGFDHDCFRVVVNKLKKKKKVNKRGIERVNSVRHTTSFDPVPLDFHLYRTSLIVIEPLREGVAN